MENTTKEQRAGLREEKTERKWSELDEQWKIACEQAIIGVNNAAIELKDKMIIVYAERLWSLAHQLKANATEGVYNTYELRNKESEGEKEG